VKENGIGGAAADNEPVAQSATRAEARGKLPPPESIIANIKLQIVKLKLKNHPALPSF